MPLPGGLAAAHSATEDRLPADRSRFLLEIIHRLQGVPISNRSTERQLPLESLLSRLDGGARAGAAAKADTVPLPLAPAFWTDTVFAGRATPDTLAAAILRSRSASLLYYALLALDDDTRAWFAEQPALLMEISQRASGAFAVAAPGLRIARNAVIVPGGSAAVPGWEAVTGGRVADPVQFVRAVVLNGEGRFAYFLSAMAQLTPAQIEFALALSAASAASRVEAARRLYAVFDRNASGWKQEERPLWRPPLDPALLVADLATDSTGRPHLPGTRRFWQIALAEGDTVAADARPSGMTAEAAVDFVWMCEQVFKGSQTVQRRPYEIVLFASRIIRGPASELWPDAMTAVRGAAAYPALFYALERIGVSDLSVYAKAARRAATLTGIENHGRATRALAQFQGAVVLLTRAAARGSLSKDVLEESLSSLADVQPNDRGEYEGRLGRWLTTFAATAGAQRPLSIGEFDEQIVRLVSGPAAATQIVEWEGTRYRIDPTAAEAARLHALLGDDAQPYLSVAVHLLAIADGLATGPGTRDDLRDHANAVNAAANTLREDRQGEWEGSDAVNRLRAVSGSLGQAADKGNKTEAAKLALPLTLLSDDLLGRGLVQLAYAIALGQPERALVSAGDAASRHDFGRRLLGFGRFSPWRYPASGADRSRDWHITGSLLGLDLRLADFSLVSLSSRPPATRPTLNEAVRRVFVETAVIAQPAAFRDHDRDAILAALRKGRERLAAVRDRGAAIAIADEIRVGAIRRTLMSWVAVHDPSNLTSFLSPTELLWLGWGDGPMPHGFHSWGTSAAVRIGCDCLQLLNRRSWESLSGRWDSGVPATVFADLNLRVTEHLHELGMPASLLASVLPAATLDFINNATSRWHDDERGLVTFVQALPLDRVEQYLALLTGNGPLFPMSDGSDMPSTLQGREVPR